MAETKSRGLVEFFVGRSEELGFLDEFTGGDAASAQSVVLRGEAGIGKTRLLSEAARRAQKRGVRVAQGSCYPVGDPGPYAPILQIIAQLAGGERSLDTLPDYLTSIEHPRDHDSAQEGRARRARLLRGAAAALIQSSAAIPTLLCVEDLQWADVGSLLLLNHVLDTRSPSLRFIGTFRTNEQTATDVRVLLDRIEQRSHIIDLDGLREDAFAQFVRHLLGSGQISEEEVRTLRSFTRGNPLFLREVILHLRDRKLLEQHSVLEAILLTRLPDRLNAVIETRFASFSKNSRRVLAAAAALGSEFDAATLGTVLEEDRVGIETELDRGVAAGVLWRTSTEPSSRYEFAHPLFAKSLYDALSAPERRELHRAIADSGHVGDIRLPSNELARHHALAFAGAGQGRAVSYCRAAAREAERLLAFETAARLWESAVVCAPRSRRVRADLLRCLGHSLANAGKWPQAIESWSKAATEYQVLQDTAGVAKVALAIGELHLWRQELDQAAHWLSRALQGLSKNSAAWAKGLALLGSVRCVQAREEGPRLLNEALESTRKRTTDPSIAIWLAHGLTALGEFEQFRDISIRGLDRAQRIGATQTAALLAGNLVISELSLARANSLDSYLEVIEAATSDSSDTAALIRSLLCRTLVGGYRGEWAKVSDLCEGWMGEIRLASRYQVATARVIWGEAQSMLGQHANAVEAVTQAIPELQQMRPLAALHLARILLQMDARADAEELVQRYRDEVISTPRLGGARLLLGDAAASLDQPELWKRCYEALQAERRPMVVGYCATSVQRVLGRLAGRLRRWDEALEHFDTAVQQLSQGCAIWELANTFVDYATVRRARHRRGDDRKAAMLDWRASSLLAPLGIPATAAASDGRRAGNGHTFDLTGRELEVLFFAAEGQRNREIAETLTLSERTVERHMENIFTKLGVETRTEAVVKAVEAGLVVLRDVVGSGDTIVT